MLNPSKTFDGYTFTHTNIRKRISKPPIRVPGDKPCCGSYTRCWICRVALRNGPDEKYAHPPYAQITETIYIEPSETERKLPKPIVFYPRGDIHILFRWATLCNLRNYTLLIC